MTKSDWYGLGSSIALHLLLLFAFGIMNLGLAEPDPIGYIEVDLGPISEGRPIQRVVEEQAQTEEEPEPEPEPEVEEQAAPPEEAKPVDLAEQEEEIQDEEEIQTPETDIVAPVTQNTPTEVENPEPQPEPEDIKPLGGGATDGTTGETEGDQGQGEQEEKAAPFQIEGLDNRSLIYQPLPSYADQVNAEIKVRITVDPQGRVVQSFPVLKGNPRLEQAIRDALVRWRFNSLPGNAPQENQTGFITFRFRLE